MAFSPFLPFRSLACLPRAHSPLVPSLVIRSWDFRILMKSGLVSLFFSLSTLGCYLSGDVSATVRFVFFTLLYFLHPPHWAASPSCCTWPGRSISFSVFLCSIVHERLPPGFACHNNFLVEVVHAQTISVWPPVPCLHFFRFFKEVTDIIISFLVFQSKVKDPS